MDIEKLKQKILDLAIRGQLVPQDPNDESASVLIEKIRKEKEELVKQGKIKANKNESYIYKGADNCYYEKIGNLLENVSTTNKEIKTKEVLKIGAFPVISQSKQNIDGYCNDNSKVIDNVPLVLFGDHTKVVKYIDIPFVPGADGTKLFKAKCYPKYLYYLIMYASFNIEDRGYGRHCAFLKSYEIPYFSSIDYQIDVSILLDYAFKLLSEIENNRDIINVLVDNIKHKILDYYFSDNSCYKSYYEKTKLNNYANIVMGQSPKSEDVSSFPTESSLEFHQGKICFTDYEIKNSGIYAKKYSKKTNGYSILLCVRAPVGVINYCFRQIAIGRGLCSIEPRNDLSIKYLYYYLEYSYNYFLKNANGSTFSAIGVDIIKNTPFLYCSLEIQNQIVNKLEMCFDMLYKIKEQIKKTCS